MAYRTPKRLYLSVVICSYITLLLYSSAFDSHSLAADVTATVTAPVCNTVDVAESTSTSDATDEVSTLEANDGAAMMTATPVIVATEEADSPLHFISFLPTDMHFNPNPETPVALIIVFSLEFQNKLGEAIHLESPRFDLAINDVPWGTLSSTDFQTGQILAYGQQGIVLQNLTIFSKITTEQQAVVACLKSHQPVDLTLSGSMDAYPSEKKRTVAVKLFVKHIVVRERTQPN